MKTEIYFAGTGGQGLISSGIILGKAATKAELNVSQSQFYGMAARGGVSNAEIIISDSEIVYPKVSEPDVIIGLSQQGFSEYAPLAKKDAYVFYDPKYVSDISCYPNAIALPIYETTLECGNIKSLNLCALGVVIGCSDVVNLVYVKDIIKESFSPKFNDINQKTFDAGYELGKSYKK